MSMPLSEREKEILELLSRGLLNKEIGYRLSISEDTVKKHNKNIFKKLVVRNRVEAIVYYKNNRNEILNQNHP
ncbi:MAG: response regulator transcription factor [Sediminibacterium sp.]|nr:response regulator transcription factor [Sediminibacterium sp.]MBX9780014.1 response regulator transcription factor [Chitinophagaceae bacterium]